MVPKREDVLLPGGPETFPHFSGDSVYILVVSHLDNSGSRAYPRKGYQEALNRHTGEESEDLFFFR